MKKYALLFPGQGSQTVGMLQALAAEHAQVGETFAEASEVLGWDLTKLVSTGPESELNRTAKTQPALLAADIAVWRIWQSLTQTPATLVAGHSLGEYAALVCAGALRFADALKLVELRGQLMQRAANDAPGAGMVAVLGLDEAGVAALCDAWPGEGLLEAANFNAPGQVVLAADPAALQWLQDNGKAYGALKVITLAMSVPSHCSLMRRAADALGEALEKIEISSPGVPVLHNLDTQVRSEPAAIRSALTEQLYRPVRWGRSVMSMREQGVDIFLECGPGKVLCGLNRRMVKSSLSLPLEDPAQLHKALESITTEA